MNRGRMGEERGGKEMNICPLTDDFYRNGRRMAPEPRGATA
jgi:hypothetical protein